MAWRSASRVNASTFSLQPEGGISAPQEMAKRVRDCLCLVRPVTNEMLAMFGQPNGLLSKPYTLLAAIAKLISGAEG